MDLLPTILEEPQEPYLETSSPASQLPTSAGLLDSIRTTLIALTIEWNSLDMQRDALIRERVKKEIDVVRLILEVKQLIQENHVGSSLQPCCQKVQFIYQKFVHFQKQWEIFQLETMCLARRKTDLQIRLFILGLKIKQEIHSNATKKIQKFFLRLVHFVFIGIEESPQNFDLLLEEMRRRYREATKTFLAKDYNPLL